MARHGAGLARDAVVGDGRVHDVRAGRPRHVAGDATVVGVGPPALGRFQRTGPFVVARQAAVAVIGDSFRLLRDRVRVVTGNAAQPTLARPEAAADVHLPDVAA